MPSLDKLRKRAAWYREYAERAGEPAIWEARLRTAKELEAEVDRLEAKAGSQGQKAATDQEAPPRPAPPAE